MLSLLSADQEDNIALRRIDVCIFQQEHTIYAVFLKHRELDEQANWTCQLLADDEVLLAPSLHFIRKGSGAALSVLTPSSRASRSLRALSLQ